MNLTKIKKINDYEWDIPKSEEMNVPGKIFANKGLVQEMDEKVYEQISNVASLPGIQKASIAMADAHWGYGFPIGGIAAFDPEEKGVISVGGIGFDINCGVRDLITNLTIKEIKPKLNELADALFKSIPAGLGSTGEIKLSTKKVDEMLLGGAEWAVEQGYGEKDDLVYTEEMGKMPNADPKNVSEVAKKREQGQAGTLGSGNHYLEIQCVEEIFEENAAKVLGLEKGRILLSIHCGSRGLGHQVGTDYLQILTAASRKYGIKIKERELVCAPIKSDEGQKYYTATCAAVNCAFANRQVLTHLSRQGFRSVISNAELKVLYDIGHNTCKKERHEIDGQIRELYVHRKGSTRAFGPKRVEVPPAYRQIGQPVLVGGSMGTCSYILVGTEEGMNLAFGSAAHGAGRVMSRISAKKTWRGGNLIKNLAQNGIIIKGHSMDGLAEEAPGAYKDVTVVVESMVGSRTAKKIAMVKPLVCIKG